jgi:hypothetical protein
MEYLHRFDDDPTLSPRLLIIPLNLNRLKKDGLQALSGEKDKPCFKENSRCCFDDLWRSGNQGSKLKRG